MKTTMRPRRPTRLLPLLLALALSAGCGDGGGSSDDPDPGPTPPANTPSIPVPRSVNDKLPDRSEDLAIGFSAPLEEFRPFVVNLEQMKDDGTVRWVGGEVPGIVNRVLPLACAGALPEYASDARLATRAYIEARPRLLHERYWSLVKQVIQQQGALGYELEQVVSYGQATTNTVSYGFSKTMGIDVEAQGGYGPFGVAVGSYYEQTSTYSEVNSVTFSKTTTETQRFPVGQDNEHTTVYGIWQLVDRFSYVDDNGVPIHESPTLQHVAIQEIQPIEFANDKTILLSATRF